jgi:hypothetical protein
MLQIVERCRPAVCEFARWNRKAALEKMGLKRKNMPHGLTFAYRAKGHSADGSLGDFSKKFILEGTS